jgi:alanyl-tRNA synthetase
MPWSVNEIRSTFIRFFEGKGGAAAAAGPRGFEGPGHAFIPSSPAVPHDDPTLMFANAGMNQFKPIFLGLADPGSDFARLKRAVNSQKCIRAGGKHNDLEDVGKDTYHHTFFEMLGNWSFGDYFKAEAIQWAWELLTEVYKLPPERLYVTYFGGDAKAGQAPDEEAKWLWSRYLPMNRILPGSFKDNFWEMGETGPCGPCSEIHFDRIGNRDAAALVNTGDPDVIEIWNNVFIQFNREKDGSLRPLPAKHVDTGMGLERLTSILQNVRSNYDTDVFAPIFAAIERSTGARSYGGRLGEADKDQVDTAYRVIADHIRTLTFAITDGAMPSNVGRGYVLRRILRRAVRYGRQMLNARPGFFSGLVPVVAQSMGEAFPELRKDPARVAAIIAEEEESFGRTLDRGIKLFQKVAEDTLAAGSTSVSGADAFKLYDTFGFPVDLTALMASERGLTVDMPAYEAERTKAEELSRAGSARDESQTLALGAEQTAHLQHMGIDPTDDAAKFNPRDVKARVRAIWNGRNWDEHASPAFGKHNLIGVVLDQTNFYAEMGGQQCDQGTISVIGRSTGGASQFQVQEVRAFAGFVLHIGYLSEGELRVNDTVQCAIDRTRRSPIASNHTATHLLNFGLRSVLGAGVDQKGSLVAPDKLRFDFSHNQPVSAAEAARVEAIVRQAIARDMVVYAEPAALGSARQISGLRAVFGEAYPDPVRVVSIGQPVADLLSSPGNPAWNELSIEFCGGTHVTSTAEIGAFAIVAEEAVAKGVRRMTGVTGEEARQAIDEAGALDKRLAAAGSLPDAQLPGEVQAIVTAVDKAQIPLTSKHDLRTKIAALQERVKAAGKAAAGAARDEAIRAARVIAESALNANEIVIVSIIETGGDRQALQAAVKAIRDKCVKSAVMLLTVEVTQTDAGEEKKVAIAAAVPDLLIQRGLKAGDWVREAAAVVGGKGGGKPDAAQGGGTDATKVKDALQTARMFALKLVGA